MRRLLSALEVELDPETQAVVDEVCGALADPWLDGQYLGLKFGIKWGIAFENTGDHECRQRIMDAVEQHVRNDPDLWMAEGGVCIPRETIARYEGSISYERDEATGEMRQVLRWPTGRYANGQPAYERKDAA